MVHLWQQMRGKPSRHGYHNQEWAEKMRSVGLVPSDTGEVRGKQTGQKMTHYVEPEGRFAKAFDAMPKAYLWPFRMLLGDASKSTTAQDKIRYTCAGCAANVWGRAGLGIVCACGNIFRPDRGAVDPDLLTKIYHRLSGQVRRPLAAPGIAAPGQDMPQSE